jgi:hypothetical protein
MEIENVAPIIHTLERQSRRNRSRLGWAGGLLAGLLLVSGPTEVQAQSCMPAFASAFARLRALEPKANTQPIADAEVMALFGPRAQACEESAYRVFMDTFEAFAKDAMRAAPPSRDKLLRLAIAAVRQAPAKVPATDLDSSVRKYRQVKSNLSATADDVGFAKTPLLQQLLDVLMSLGAPSAAVATVPVPTAQPDPTPTPTTAPTGSGGVQQIRVPTQPLPPWAVIKVYEMRDLIRAQDLPGIQLRLQEVINWMESSTRDQQ